MRQRGTTALIGVWLAGATSLATPASASGTRHVVAAAPDDAPVSFEVELTSRDPVGLDRLLERQQDPSSADYRRWLTPEEFDLRFGPQPARRADAAALLRKAGFVVSDAGPRLHVEGTAGTAQRFLGAPMVAVREPTGEERIVAAASLHAPQRLESLGARIIGLSTTIRQRSAVREARRGVTGTDPQNRSSSRGAYWFDDLKQAYDGPSVKRLDGSGRTIAILMDGDIKDSDTASYFHDEKLAPPTVLHVPVGKGAKFDPNGDSVESSLDVQQAGGMAPGATIMLYMIHNLSDDTILAGLQQIVGTNRADVVSMSFGGCEKAYSAAYNGGTADTGELQSYQTLFKQGNAQGITFVSSSGDNGALGCPPAAYFNGQKGSYKYGVGPEFPATSPNVTAVGGTNLITAYHPPSLDSSYVSENANADRIKPEDPFGEGSNVGGGYFGSGGGTSFYFSKPTYQQLFATGSSYRTVPDLALQMGGCPTNASSSCGTARSAVTAIVDGKEAYLIGTSASAPSFAGVVALWNQMAKKRLGNVNPAIYKAALAERSSKSAGAFRQDITGYNGKYRSTVTGSAPYNMVIGNGSVDIRKLIGASALPAAGIPQTPTNP